MISSSESRLKLIELLQSERLYPLLMPDKTKDKYFSLDLSIHNPDLQNVDISSASSIQRYIELKRDQKKKAIGFGGYLEERAIYRRSQQFTTSTDPKQERNIHLGIDFWCDAGTSVHIPLNGKLHSYADNLGLGNYGPTIIFEHSIEEIRFFTLYGHLSKASIENLEINQLFEKGQKIAELGTTEVNGDYAPHLHFQIVIDLGDYLGDFPGVCSKQDLQEYVKNCPNPDIFVI